jgi:hypothetical protein
MQSAEHYRKIYKKKIEQDVAAYLTPEREKKIHEKLEKAAAEGHCECFIDFQHGLSETLAAGLQEHWAENHGICTTMQNGGVLFEWGADEDDTCALDEEDDAS